MKHIDIFHILAMKNIGSRKRDEILMIKVMCAIINFDDKVVAVQRSEQMHLPLKWEFPGGKIEPNESEEDCLKRELKEELNIDVLLKKRLTPSIFHYPNISIELIPFTADYIGGDIILKEHRMIQFLEIDELMNLDWAEADIPIVKEYLSL